MREPLDRLVMALLSRSLHATVRLHNADVHTTSDVRIFWCVCLGRLPQILQPLSHSVVRRQSVEIEVLITGLQVYVIQ